MVNNPRIALFYRGSYEPSSSFLYPVKRKIMSAAAGVTAGVVSKEFEGAGAVVKPHDIIGLSERELERALAESDVAAFSAKLVDYRHEIPAARRAKDLGKPVVFGGAQPSLDPKPLLDEGFSVVSGEFEGLGGQVIGDALSGKGAKLYCQDKPTPLGEIDISPDRGKMKRNPWFYPVETSRGCHNNCQPHCTILSRGEWRGRPLGEIDRELKEANTPFISIPDNNLVAIDPGVDLLHAAGKIPERQYRMQKDSYEHGIELGHLLKKHGRKAIVQISPGAILYDIEHGERLLSALGGNLIDAFMGFEDVTRDTPGAKDKKAGTYRQVVEALHRHNIPAHISLVFGEDGQDRGTFEGNAEFILINGIEGVSPQILTPYPGTSLYRRLEEEGRIIIPYGLDEKGLDNLRYYNHKFPVFLPEGGLEAFMENYIAFVGKMASKERLKGLVERNGASPVRNFLAGIVNAGTLIAKTSIESNWAKAKEKVYSAYL